MIPGREEEPGGRSRNFARVCTRSDSGKESGLAYTALYPKFDTVAALQLLEVPIRRDGMLQEPRESEEERLEEPGPEVVKRDPRRSAPGASWKRMSGRAFEDARCPRFVVQLLEVPMVETRREGRLKGAQRE